MNYKLGTHNSMSYLSPLKWWHKPFHFMSRCQRVSIQEQYEKHNARYFDLRVTFYKGEWRFAHGKTIFKSCTQDLDDVFRFLNKKGDAVVRLVLETNKRDKTLETRFQTLCYGLTRDNPKVTCIGGYTKADWSTLFTSVIPKPIYIYEAVSSTTGNILDDWCPFIYAKRYNKDNYAQGTAKDFLVLDFIDIKE